MTSKFIYVQVHKRRIGRQCMHCCRPATTSAVRKTGRIRMKVYYCDEHREIIIEGAEV